jgi:hypothetical protein
MRFRKGPRVAPYEETGRKRAAFLAKQQRERGALPLFADDIAAGQRGVDEEMAHRAEAWPLRQQADRDWRASKWREVRARLFVFDDALRTVIRRIWRTCPYPADPSYFGDLLHHIRLGKIDPHRPPWKCHARVQAKTTPNPRAFDEAFRQIGQRKVGGGPKSTEADELLFCGNLGNAVLFLTSRVKLIEPNESFYTSSNHRLRDSHIGRSGHWVDIEVRGVCSDADLALIQRLTQAADQRAVRIRRAERKVPLVGEDGGPERHRLLVLACSATKRHDPGYMPACERYDGPLWRTWRAVDPNRRLARAAFLSARYGFRSVDSPIEDYDARLTPDLAQRMIAGGMGARWPRPSSPRKPDNCGSHPGCEIASLAHHGNRPFTDVALVGGGLYLDVMRGFLGGFRELGCVTPDARVVEINAGIGVMRQRLRAWLEGGGAAARGRGRPGAS